ncbi:MAG: hypothetical protein QF805_14220 [Pirellulaceae bacterium]|nr:hypothetical protein [Pirellulaceae bacterium]
MSTLLAAFVGGLTGLFVVTVFGQWYDGFFANLMAGGCVGLGCGVCLGGVMGMHSVSIGSAANQVQSIRPAAVHLQTRAALNAPGECRIDN